MNFIRVSIQGLAFLTLCFRIMWSNYSKKHGSDWQLFWLVILIISKLLEGFPVQDFKSQNNNTSQFLYIDTISYNSWALSFCTTHSCSKDTLNLLEK